MYVNLAAKKLFTKWNEGEDIDRIEKQYVRWREQNQGRDSAYWEDELTVGGVKRFFGFEYLSMYDEDGASIGCFFRIEDKTEDMKRLRDEKYRATHDRLTGLYNREGFSMRLRALSGSMPVRACICLHLISRISSW